MKFIVAMQHASIVLYLGNFSIPYQIKSKSVSPKIKSKIYTFETSFPFKEFPYKEITISSMQIDQTQNNMVVILCVPILHISLGQCARLFWFLPALVFGLVI